MEREREEEEGRKEERGRKEGGKREERGRREGGEREERGRREGGNHSQSYSNAGSDIKRLRKLLTRTVQDLFQMRWPVTVNSQKGYTASLLLQIS